LFDKKRRKNCFHSDLRGGEKTGPDKKGVAMDVVNRERERERERESYTAQPKRLVILENSKTVGQTHLRDTQQLYDGTGRSNGPSSQTRTDTGDVNYKLDQR